MSPVLDWLVELMRTIGAPGVGVATAVETVFPPMPSEVVLPLAGYTASQGHYGLVGAVLWATAGSVAGAWVLYYAGLAWGFDRVRRVAERIPLVHGEDVDRAVVWFQRHGRSAILLGRMVPGVRSLISIPAGMDRMPLVQFTLYTAVGSLAWNLLLVGAGYELGAQWHLVEGYVGDLSNVLAALLAAAVAVFVVRRLLRRRRQRRSAGARRDGLAPVPGEDRGGVRGSPDVQE